MTVTDRFWKKVNKTDTCWLWTASKTKGGYGKFWNGVFLEEAHRFSYKLLVGPIKDNLHVLHSCDIRNCVNPKHLRQGTEIENRRDAIERKRWSPNVGTAPAIQRNKKHCPFEQSLVEAVVLVVEWEHVEGEI